MHREKSCGALVVRRDEENGKSYLLMIRHKQGGHRSFPKGHMEAGETEYMTAVREVFDLRPEEIIRYLDLRRPIYAQTAAYGHFGRPELNLPWEQDDMADKLRELAQYDY